MTTQLNPRAMCQSVKDETLLLQYNSNNTQAFISKKLKWNEITQGGQWELKDLTLPKPIKLLTTPLKIIQHTDGVLFKYNLVQLLNTHLIKILYLQDLLLLILA